MPNPWEKDWSGHTVVQTPRGQGIVGPSLAERQGIETAGQIEAAGGKKRAEAQSEAQINLPEARYIAEEAKKQVAGLINHPGFKGSVGFRSLPGILSQQEGAFLSGLAGGSNEAGFKSRLDQLKGSAFLQAFQGLKGGGQITEIEGAKGTAARNRMNTATSEHEFRQAADDYVNAVNENMHLLEMKSQGKFNQYQAPKQNQPQSVDELLNIYLQAK